MLHIWQEGIPASSACRAASSTCALLPANALTVAVGMWSAQVSGLQRVRRVGPCECNKMSSPQAEGNDAPIGLPLAPDEAWVGAWEYVRDNTTAPAAAPEQTATASSPSPGAVSAYSLHG